MKDARQRNRLSPVLAVLIALFDPAAFGQSNSSSDPSLRNILVHEAQMAAHQDVHDCMERGLGICQA